MRPPPWMCGYFPAFVDIHLHLWIHILNQSKVANKRITPNQKGKSFDSAFLDSTLKKLLNLATKIEKLRKALVCRQLNVNIRFLVILKNAFYTYKSDFSSVKCILFHVEIFFLYHIQIKLFLVQSTWRNFKYSFTL